MEKSTYNDLEDMVYRFPLTYNRIIDILNLKYIPSTNIRYTPPPGINESIDIILVLKSLFPEEVKVNVTVDDIRLKPSLVTNKTIKFTKKSFFCFILGSSHSPLGELSGIDGLIRLIPGKNKSGRLINITVINKVHLKAD